MTNTITRNLELKDNILIFKAIMALFPLSFQTYTALVAFNE